MADMTNETRRRAAALHYEHGKGGAPTLVAKGQGFIAEKILASAQQHGVPIHHDPALVDALSRLDLGEQIPTELFSAVATVIAFIYRLKMQQESR
jgi:flagellar biosynthesis protein